MVIIIKIAVVIVAVTVMATITMVIRVNSAKMTYI